MKSCLDPKFKYVPAAATDIRKTFARVRRQLTAQPKAPVVAEIKPQRKANGR